MKKAVILRGILKSHDPERKTLIIGISASEEFTFSFLSNMAKKNNSPVNMDVGEFRAKYKSIWNLRCFRNKKKDRRMPVDDLLDNHINVKIQVKPYIYKKHGKTTYGQTFGIIEIWGL